MACFVRARRVEQAAWRLNCMRHCVTPTVKAMCSTSADSDDGEPGVESCARTKQHQQHPRPAWPQVEQGE